MGEGGGGEKGEVRFSDKGRCLSGCSRHCCPLPSACIDETEGGSPPSESRGNTLPHEPEARSFDASPIARCPLSSFI